MEVYVGIDVGSVTTKFAVLNEQNELLYSNYMRTQGKPIAVIQEGLRDVAAHLPSEALIKGIGTTGSGRMLAGVVVGADVVKNEITAHAVGAAHYVPDVQTVIEIGGQDSKFIILRGGIVVDFAMNTVCAAGTGAFLDQQAARLNMRIEDFGPLSLKSKTPVRIAGRCTVFAESDMIHKQQMGHRIEDILYGLCEAMARNYLNNLGLGKEILPPVVFQGGVAANVGIVRAFEEALKTQIQVPPHHHVIGAIGAAILAHEHMSLDGRVTKFKGFGISEVEYTTSSFDCKACSNVCEIVQIKMNREVVARWGGRCGMWDT
ncbi:MAG: acyl-CoA dehydratase activase [Chloroflexi bacterium]|nr:acyl-CoA dehydratase activase [Chloroflexota bacterium]MCL5075242.1 acyl-CoA dehydratase activase [Chloroflexota bacterium]